MKQGALEPLVTSFGEPQDALRAAWTVAVARREQSGRYRAAGHEQKPSPIDAISGFQRQSWIGKALDQVPDTPLELTLVTHSASPSDSAGDGAAGAGSVVPVVVPVVVPDAGDPGGEGRPFRAQCGSTWYRGRALRVSGEYASSYRPVIIDGKEYGSTANTMKTWTAAIAEQRDHAEEMPIARPDIAAQQRRERRELDGLPKWRPL